MGICAGRFGYSTLPYHAMTATHVYIHARTHTHKHVHTHVCMHVYPHVHTDVHADAYIHACTHVYLRFDFLVIRRDYPAYRMTR